MRVLVTGGAGYVGRFCVQRLLDTGQEPVVIDRLPMPALRRGAPLFVRGDIRAEGFVADVIRQYKPAIVLHLAAEKSVERSMEAPGPHLAHNVLGTVALLEAMRGTGVAKIVFSSSAAVYGAPDEVPVSEHSPLRPSNPYGAGKVMVEELLRWYHVCHAFASVSLRYFNAAGAALEGSMGEDWSASTSLIPKIMDAVLGRSGPLPIFGTDYPTPDGTAVRDYVHIEDVVDAHMLAIEHVLASPGAIVVNVGTGQGHSVREVISAAERLVGRRVPCETSIRRAGDAPAVWADVGTARRLLGWRARYGLDDILRTAWLWHSQHLSTNAPSQRK